MSIIFHWIQLCQPQFATECNIYFPQAWAFYAKETTKWIKLCTKYTNNTTFVLNGSYTKMSLCNVGLFLNNNMHIKFYEFLWLGFSRAKVYTSTYIGSLYLCYLSLCRLHYWMKTLQILSMCFLVSNWITFVSKNHLWLKRSRINYSVG